MGSDDEMGDGRSNTLGEAHPKAFTGTVKLPSFYVATPRFWFIRAEGEFTMKGITESALKFHYVAEALPEEVALWVMPTLEGDANYNMLNWELLLAYELTDAQRAVKLLHLPDLGEKLPSTLAAEIIALVPRNATPGYLEHQIFLEQLP